MPIRTVYTDPNLKTSTTQHFSVSVQRQLTANIAVEGAYVGKVGDDLVGHNYFNAAPYINSPITGLPPTLQNVEERAPLSPGIISAQSRVLGNFFRSEYHSLQLRLERRMAKTFAILGSYAFSKNLTNQPENTQGLISSIPNPFDLDSLWGPSFLDRRHVIAASWVWSPQHEFGNAVVGALLNDWTITGMHRIQTGPPLVFTMGTDVAQNGILQPNGQYALLVPGATADDVQRDHSSREDMVNAFFDTAAFVPLNLVPRGIYGERRARAHLRSRRRHDRSRGPAEHRSAAGHPAAGARRVLQRVQPGQLQHPEHDAVVHHVRAHHRRGLGPRHSARGQANLVSHG